LATKQEFTGYIPPVEIHTCSIPALSFNYAAYLYTIYMWWHLA